MSRQKEVERLEKEGEEGMVHSLLSGMPDISDDAPSTSIHGELSIPSAEYQPNSDLSHPPVALPVGEQVDGVPRGDIDEALQNMEDQESGPLLHVPNDSEAAAILDPERPPTQPLEESTRRPMPDRVAFAESVDNPSLLQSKADEVNEKKSNPQPITPSHRRASLSLTSLLTHADELYSLYPPTHPSVSLSSIFGPQSVVFTWSEDLSEMPDDDEAELMASKMELIVWPYVEPVTEDKELDDNRGTDKRRKPRKLRKPLSLAGLTVQRRTVVTGAVLALSICIAFYSIRSRPMGSLGFAEAHPRLHSWRRLAACLGLGNIGRR